MNTVLAPILMLIITFAVILHDYRGDHGVVFMSLAGSSVYVLSKSDIPVFVRGVFLFIGMYIGIRGHEFVASLINATVLVNINPEIPNDLAAFITSATCIFLITTLYSIKNISELGEMFRKAFNR